MNHAELVSSKEINTYKTWIPIRKLRRLPNFFTIQWIEYNVDRKSDALTIILNSTEISARMRWYLLKIACRIFVTESNTILILLLILSLSMPLLTVFPSHNVCPLSMDYSCIIHYRFSFINFYHIGLNYFYVLCYTANGRKF